MKRSFSILLALSFAFGACSDPFSHSPFQVSVEERLKNTTAKNLDRIAKADTVGRIPFNVALLSDSHYHFESLSDAIGHINSRSDISFVFVVGDITENGLQKEFQLFQDIMDKCKVPYLTVIGNHDHLSNGAKVYQQIFGSLNYSFSYHSVKFIAWDNVFWESRKSPDFEWLGEQLKNGLDDGSATGIVSDQIIPIAHIPPSDQQFGSTAAKYHQLLSENKVRLSVHGHKHRYSRNRLFDDDIEFLTVGSPQYREYSVLSFSGGSVTIDRIKY